MGIMLEPMVVAVNVEWIGYAVIGVVIAVSWVAGAIKKQNEEQARRTREARGGEPGGDSDFAARRRSQLRDLAQDRLQAQGGRPRESDGSGLTMAERIERARAQAQHPSRTAHTQVGSPSPAASSPSPRVSPSRLEELRRIRHEAESRLARQEAQRQAHLRQQQLLQQRRQQQAQSRQAQVQAQAQAQARAQRRARQEALLRRRQQAERDAEREAARLAEARAEGEHHSSASGRTASPAELGGPFRLDRGNLRQAFVLKEILDKPLAMRDPLAAFDE